MAKKTKPKITKMASVWVAEKYRTKNSSWMGYGATANEALEDMKARKNDVMEYRRIQREAAIANIELDMAQFRSNEAIKSMVKSSKENGQLKIELKDAQTKLDKLMLDNKALRIENSHITERINAISQRKAPSKHVPCFQYPLHIRCKTKDDYNEDEMARDINKINDYVSAIVRKNSGLMWYELLKDKQIDLRENEDELFVITTEYKLVIWSTVPFTNEMISKISLENPKAVIAYA